VTTATATHVAPPKHILLPSGHKIRFRFIQQVLWTAIAVSLGTACVAGLYYLLFEVRYGPVYLKPGWDGLFSQSWWTIYRHGLRDVGEGVLANLAVRSLITKWQKHADQRLAGGKLAVKAAQVLVASFVLILLGVWLVNYALPFLWHHAHFSLITSPLNATGATSNVVSGFNWQDFTIGFVITHIIRTMWKPVGNTINAALIDGSVYRAHGRTPLWVRLPIAPPTMRERFAWTQRTHPDVAPQGDLAVRILMVCGVLALLVAGYGEYVLHVIAKG